MFGMSKTSHLFFGGVGCVIYSLNHLTLKTISSGHLLDLEVINGSKYSVKEIEVDEKIRKKVFNRNRCSIVRCLLTEIKI